MQEMSVGMAALLKSGKMIGDNRPTAEVVIGDGNKFSYDWTNPTNFYTPNTANPGVHPSIVELSNGTLMYVYDVGGSVFQTIVPDVETIITQSDSIISEVEIFTGLYNPRATVCKGPNDNLYLILAHTGTTTINDVAKIEIYKSVLGDGTDWTLETTLQSIVWDATFTYSPARNLPVGTPYYFNNLWVLPIVSFYNYSGYLAARVSIWTSPDFLTWTVRHTDGRGPGNINTTALSRNIAEINGEIWFAMHHDYITNTVTFKKSTDGISWSDEFTKTSEIPSSSFINDSDILYWISTDVSSPSIYKTEVTPTSSTDFILEYSSDSIFGGDIIATKIDDTVIVAGGSKVFGVSVESDGKTLQPKSITINKSKGMAGGLTLELDNKAAILAPDGTANPQLLWPNKEVVVKQGYGEELLTTFTGLIDSISMSTFPQSVTISARDMMKPLLDHYLRNAEFLYTLTYTNMTVEHIWENLMILAGVETNIIEETGLTISEKTFSWETYGDAISWLDEIAGFETYCDEFGKMNFVRDGRPVDATVVYEFEEGVDLIKPLGYDINDEALYYAVVVYGKSPEVLDEEDNVVTPSSVLYFAKQLPQAEYWNIPSGKIMRIDASDADTQEKCEIIADKAIYLMQTRAREVKFNTIGIPHLQRGDFVRVTETSTTISEIYRITNISTTQVAEGGYTMTITCYWHSAPEVV